VERERIWTTDRFPEKILLATDGSEDAALAGRVAVDLSRSMGAQLHVVHAWQTEIRRAYEVTLPITLREWCEQRAAELLAKEVRRIEEAGGEVAEAHLVMGRPMDAILGLCEALDPVLVIMGSRGLGPVRRIFLGSVSEGVVHHANSPVLVVRGGSWAWPVRRVVVGMDYSEEARAAGELASIIGKHYGARGILIRVYPEIMHWAELQQDQRETYERLIQNLLESEKRTLENSAAGAAELGELLGRPPEVEVSVGDPTAAILKAADDEESTLIAVGSRGLGATGRARLGSVSTKILRAARGPVLVCRHTAAGKGFDQG
jgi:nucleotide-binding universal stress UspA family protein